VPPVCGGAGGKARQSVSGGAAYSSRPAADGWTPVLWRVYIKILDKVRVVMMTINITKAKLTRWIIAAVIFFCAPVQAVDVPDAVTAAVAQRGFMAGFKGYDGYSLLDVYWWRPGFYAVIMLCPVGFHETFVFDCRDGRQEAVYRDVFIPKKKTREEMRKNSILVADAVRLAKAAVAKEAGFAE
jgi:hypothetical protein